MKRLGVAILVIVLHASASGEQVADKPTFGDEIRERTERYLDAIERRDTTTLDALLAEECQIVYPRAGTETKAALLQAQRQAGAAKGSILAESTLSDVTVRRVGDTAVLTSTVATKRGDGPAINSRRTLTWSRQGDRWRLLHDHWSLLGDAREAEFWSHFFRGDNQNFNRKPNSLLAQAIDGLPPGKALDVGVGEGRNAVCLAERGWAVTGIDRAEGALAVARQRAIERGVRITPILQTAEEFDWGQQRWDLIALLYVPAVRGNLAKIRESLKPGGLVVIEAFLTSQGSSTGSVTYEPGELRRLFEEDFDILRYEEGEGIADYGQARSQLVRLVGRRKAT